MADDFDLATVLTDVAEALVAGGVRSASPDPTEVVTPGVWVQCAGFDRTRLDGGYDVDVRLLLTVEDNGHMRSVKALSRLYRKVAAVMAPTGPVTPALSLLDEDTNLPALAVPVRVRWTPDH